MRRAEGPTESGGWCHVSYRHPKLAVESDARGAVTTSCR